MTSLLKTIKYLTSTIVDHFSKTQHQQYQTMRVIFDLFKKNTNAFAIGIKGKKRGIVVFSNVSHSAALGKKPEEIEGMHIRDVFPHLSEDIIQRFLLTYDRIRANKKGEADLEPQKQPHEDGSEHDWLVGRVPAKLDGVPVIIGIGQDITKLVMAEEELKAKNEEIATQMESLAIAHEHAKATNVDLTLAKVRVEAIQKEMKKLMKVIGHDVRGKLESTVLPYLAIISENISDLFATLSLTPDNQVSANEIISEIASVYESITEASNESKKLIYTIESVSKASLSMKKEYQDANLFLQGIHCSVQKSIKQQERNYKLRAKTDPSFSEKKVSLNIDPGLAGVLDGCLTDYSFLESVLTNLLGNAIKFTQEGTVSLGYSVLEESATMRRIQFTISDTGPGIPKQYLSKLFDPSSDNKSIPNKDVLQAEVSNGVGLHNCAGLVASLGGTISVESEVESEVGVGTTFLVEIPFDVEPTP